MDRLPDALEKYVEGAVTAAINRPPISSGSTGAAFIREQKTADFTAAILAFLNAAEKDGWELAPMEATDTMLEAGRKAWKARRLHVSHAASDGLMTCDVIYRAMLDAAKEEGNE